MTNHFRERATCLLSETKAPSAFPQVMDLKTLSPYHLLIHPEHPSPKCNAAHSFASWYKWEWLEQGLIDSSTHPAWQDSRTFTWSSPEPPDGIKCMSLRACVCLCFAEILPFCRSEPKKTNKNPHGSHLHSIVFAEKQHSLLRRDWWQSFKRLERCFCATLIYSVCDFDLSAGVRVVNIRGVLV